ncbi:MAG: hypothetical protein GEU78_18430 [Actinobacteria bacterium]|nr:hypothetical protein [Actinomycetota bacterium]
MTAGRVCPSCGQHIRDGEASVMDGRFHQSCVRIELHEAAADLVARAVQAQDLPIDLEDEQVIARAVALIRTASQSNNESAA